MSHKFQETLQLATLAIARREEHIDELEYARRSTELLDRAGWREITIVDYLESKGLKNGELAKRAARFGKIVADAYRSKYDSPPPQRAVFIKQLKDTRAVNVYLEWDFDWLDQLYVDTFGGVL